MKFSVLMSIYHNEHPDFFNRAMISIWDEQSLRPSEIVLVIDGPIGENLSNTIDLWKSKLGCFLTLVPLEYNLGLGDALNKGLIKCKFDIVARMDTDDISAPDRFMTQVTYLSKNLNIDVIGGWVSEFESDEREVLSERCLPLSHDDIISFAKKRNPMNHPTVVFRKNSVLSAGGYKKFDWLEDYFLWVRMIQNGNNFANIPECLVLMRAGYGQLKRRSGIKYAFSELKLQKELLNTHFISKKEFVFSLFTRVLVRILPQFLLKYAYKKIRNKSW